MISRAATKWLHWYARLLYVVQRVMDAHGERKEGIEGLCRRAARPD